MAFFVNYNKQAENVPLVKIKKIFRPFSQKEDGLFLGVNKCVKYEGFDILSGFDIVNKLHNRDELA